MLNLARVARIAGFGSRNRATAPWFWRRNPPPASAVTFEFGRGDAAIIATVQADGRARLELGSGETFIGPYDEMPATVTHGARKFLEAAGRWRRTRFPRNAAQERGPVHVIVQKDDDFREVYVTLAEMRDPDSALAPLWEAFTRWLGPFLVVLFGESPGQPSADESPALTRARGLCRRP